MDTSTIPRGDYAEVIARTAESLGRALAALPTGDLVIPAREELRLATLKHIADALIVLAQDIRYLGIAD